MGEAEGGGALLHPHVLGADEGFEFVSLSQLKPVSGPMCGLAWVLLGSSVASPVLFLNLIVLK